MCGCGYALFSDVGHHHWLLGWHGECTVVSREHSIAMIEASIKQRYL